MGGGDSVKGIPGSVRGVPASVKGIPGKVLFERYSFGLLGYPHFEDDSNALKEAAVVGFNNHMYFGSVVRSMISLFSISLLAEWKEVVRPAWK